MVIFEEGSHKYFHKVTGEVYISVTSLIGLYKSGFNEAFWSLYEAYKRFRGWGRYEMSDAYFRVAGLREDVGDLERFIGDDLGEVRLIQEEVCKEWAGRRRSSLERGRLYHRGREEALVREGGVVLPMGTDLGGIKLGDGVYPELILYNERYRVAGRSDKVVVKGGDVVIYDYKVSDGDLAHGYHQCMKEPLGDLPDCPLTHYTLQLSLYGYMLECFGYRVKELKIMQIGVEMSYRIYKVNYCKHTVINLLEHYTWNRK